MHIKNSTPVALAAGAVLLAAGCGSSGNTHALGYHGVKPPVAASAKPSPSPSAAQEKITSGALIKGDGSHVPITLSGGFADTGFINLNSKKPAKNVAVMVLTKGNLLVTHSPGKPVTNSRGKPVAPSVNRKTCYASFTIAGTFAAKNGGTGAYVNATGGGTYRVTFAGVLPRKHGHCNGNANPTAATARVSFTATGAITP